MSQTRIGLKMSGLSLSGEAKAFELDLARVQAFVLDPVGPLVQLLEACQLGVLEQDEAISTLSVAITLLENASSQISRLTWIFKIWPTRKRYSRRHLLKCL